MHDRTAIAGRVAMGVRGVKTSQHVDQKRERDSVGHLDRTR